MSEITHLAAVYYDENNVRKKIRADDLKIDSVFENAKLQVLFDISEQVRLAARPSPKGLRHFYELGSQVKGRKTFEGESDPVHNKRVGDLAKTLAKASDFVFVIDWRGRHGKSKEEVLYRLSGYNWGEEVTRIINKGVIVRHDIYGRDSDLAMSIKRPSIAIEVINTHFPEEIAFAAMLRQSEEIPSIIVFDFTAKPGAFLKISSHYKKITISAWTFFIESGKLWHDGKDTGVTTAAGFKIEADKLFASWEDYRLSQVDKKTS